MPIFNRSEYDIVINSIENDEKSRFEKANLTEIHPTWIPQPVTQPTRIPYSGEDNKLVFSIRETDTLNKIHSDLNGENVEYGSITNIKINSIWNKINIEIKSDSINLLIGKNGTGKTTVITIIEAILSHDVKTLAKVFFFGL